MVKLEQFPKRKHHYRKLLTCSQLEVHAAETRTILFFAVAGILCKFCKALQKLKGAYAYLLQHTESVTLTSPTLQRSNSLDSFRLP